VGTNLNGIVKYRGGGVQLQLVIRRDNGLTPTTLLIPIHFKHVVGERSSEYKLVIGCFLLGVFRAGNCQILGLHKRSGIKIE
jgi:hypothetical protein